MAWGWVVAGVLLVLGVLYLRLLKTERESLEGLAKARQEALDRADSTFFEELREERRKDAEEAAAIRDDAGADKFLRDSLRTR